MSALGRVFFFLHSFRYVANYSKKKISKKRDWNTLYLVNKVRNYVNTNTVFVLVNKGEIRMEPV